ncbi:MAG TPA: ATP-binding cassette domain-containing protein [Candidatus Acetothermia bacterium]|nr:ATP-binding cassette domain-containing protein [Candidatus Acetothermia bacterium]
MSKAIEVEDLVKVYRNGTRAVDGISFSVDEKEIFGFLGPNGAGKSTTIKTLVGLIRATSGTLRLRGVDIHRHPGEIKRQTGYASQETAVDDRLTGWENITLQGHYYHLPSKEIAQRSEEVLKIFDIYERRKDLADSYSGGMLKRIDIALALIHRPAVLFLDEPTLGLDVQTRTMIWSYIDKLRKEYGMTIFITTHYMEEADALCDRVAIIDHGRIQALDRPGVLKQQIGGDIITVRFSASNDGAIPALIEAIQGLTNIKEVGPAQDGIYRIIAVRNGDQLIPKIVELGEQHAVATESIRLRRPSLDDVYLKFTGREMRDEEGSREKIGKNRRTQRRLNR